MFKRKNIRVLHVGLGFIPWWGGGYIEYAEDLMEEQVRQGYEVYYFCSGRHYPIFRKTFLKKWKNPKGFIVYELINSPIYFGGDNGTINDLDSQVCENYFLKILNETKPDIIHFQHLGGLPSSLIDIAVSRKIPTIMTLQDYTMLCPTVKLFDYMNQVCLDFEDGKKCPMCCKNVSNNLQSLVKQTISYEFRKYKLYTPAKLFYKIFLKKIPFYLIKRIEKKDKGSKYLSCSLHDFFKLRREKNIERLKKIDLLIAQSKKVEKIYRHYLGLDEYESKDKIIMLHLTVKHVEKIVPKRLDKISYPIKFATLNGCASIPKGALLMLETIRILHNKGLSSYFEFHIFGGIIEEVRRKILQFNNTFYHGPYKLSELNEILENVDVGIVPSIWEEAYGYVGIEFLAKGIPVIGNNKGGIVDYTIDGFTGFVNYDNNAEGMANIIAKIISEPNIIKILNGKIIENRSKIIKTMEQHFCELDEIYRRIIESKKLI